MGRPSDVPEFATAPTVRLDQAMPEKDSIVVLSDAAFRLMIEAICYCGRNETDGLIPVAWMKKNGRPKTIKELVDQGHLTQPDTLRYRLTDYLRWNRAGDEIDSIRASKSESGQKGAHMRWHVPSRKKVDDCAFCYPNRVGGPNA